MVTLKCELEVTQGHCKLYYTKDWAGFLFAFHSNYGRIFSHFGDIQRQRIWPDLEIWIWGRSSSSKMAPFDRVTLITSTAVTFCWSAINN